MAEGGVSSDVLESMRQSRGAGSAEGGGPASVLNVGFGGKKFEGISSMIGKIQGSPLGELGGLTASLSLPKGIPGAEKFIGQGGGRGL